MATRTINIAILEQNPQVRILRFIPRIASVDGEVLTRRPYVVATNADGEATIDLPVKGSGSLRYDYEIEGYDGLSEGHFFLAAGSAIDLDDLLAAGGVATDSVIEYVEDAVSDAIAGLPGEVSDAEYDATSWNGVAGVAPSKNVVRDKFVSIDTAVTNLGDAVDGLGDSISNHEAVKASDSVLGHVKVDGETITIDGDGVISTSGIETLPAASSVNGADLVAVYAQARSTVWKCINESGVGAGKSITIGGLSGVGGTGFTAEDNAAFWEWVNDNKASIPAISVGEMDGNSVFAITLEPNSSIVINTAANPGPLFAQDILIAGAGSEDDNGILPVNGVKNNRPFFGVVGVTTYVEWSSTVWLIRMPSGERHYNSTDNVGTPDLCTTWTLGAQPGELPVPTVTATPVASPATTVKATLAQTRRSEVVTKSADFVIEAADAGVTFDVTTDLTVSFNSDIPVGFICKFYSRALVYIDTGGGEVTGIENGPFAVGVAYRVPHYWSLIKISDTRWAANTELGEP